MDRLHIVITAVGAIFFLWFAIPLIAGIINIGNMTGMIISAMLAGYGFFYRMVHMWIAKIWQQNVGKVALSVVLVVAAAVAFVVVVETVCIVRAAMHHPPTNTTAVLLGCKVNGTTPSTVLAERIEAAYDYLMENPQAACVLSGGKGDGEDISEAECMYRSLTKKGIAPERLILEDKSTTTEENLNFSKELLKEHGIEGSITIVTSEFHEYRANKTAERLGIKSYSTPSATFFIYLPTYYVRELYGILYYMVR